MDKLKEKICIKLAWMLPRRLVMWCAARVGAHATTGQYGTTVVPDLLLVAVRNEEINIVTAERDQALASIGATEEEV